MIQPNPNMTHEELHDSLIPTLMVFGSNFDPIERPNEANSITDKAIDELIQLFATLCAEVIGDKYTEIQMANLAIDARIRAEAVNHRIDRQFEKIAQLTIKNTEEENV